MPPPTVIAPATVGDENPQSPTVMLQAYLRSRGMPLTSQNMQRVLTENARNSADIPGLVNQAPSTDPGVGQQGNVAANIEKAPTRGGNLPVPPIPPRGGDYGDAENPPMAARAAAGNTADNATRQQMNLAPLILGGAALGAGAYGANRMFGRSSAPPTPGSSVPPPVDPAAAVNAEQVAQATSAQPQDAQTGDRFDVTPPAEGGSPMEAAMQRAMQPQADPRLGGAVTPQAMAIAQARETLRPGGGGPSTVIGPTSPTGVQVPTDVQPGGIVPRPPMPDRSLNIPTPPGQPVIPPRTTDPGLNFVPTPKRFQAPVRVPIPRGIRLP